MEQLLWFQRKQIVIRMRMTIQRLQSDLNSVSKLRQVITKPCKIIMMPLLMQHHIQKRAHDVLNQTIIVSDVNGTVVEVADSVGPISKES